MAIDVENRGAPKEAIQALDLVLDLLGSMVVGVYLFGSAVSGGLRIDSDVDILVVVDHGLSEQTRRELAARLMLISGKIGNPSHARPLEVTVMNRADVVPWRYPPRKEFLYGEWLRTKFEKGQIQEPTYDSDLAIILRQARENSFSLFGPDACDVLVHVPTTDIRSAIMDSLPGLLESLKGDERNVILTLARMWLTAVVGEIAPKDVAAEWAIPRLPQEHAALLDLARRAYRGEYVDHWEGLTSEVQALADHMKESIESCLSI